MGSGLAALLRVRFVHSQRRVNRDAVRGQELRRLPDGFAHAACSGDRLIGDQQRRPLDSRATEPGRCRPLAVGAIQRHPATSGRNRRRQITSTDSQGLRHGLRSDFRREWLGRGLWHLV